MTTRRSDRKILQTSEWSVFVQLKSQGLFVPTSEDKKVNTGVNDHQYMDKFSIRIRKADTRGHVAFPVIACRIMKITVTQSNKNALQKHSTGIKVRQKKKL